MKYDSLTVLEKAFKASDGRWKYRCKCNCGNECFRSMNQLKNKHYSSCGCAVSEMKKTHGMKYTRVYRIWSSMKNRCTNPNDSDFEKYSALGVCDEWLSFGLFFLDMGEPPTADHQIDRIDNTKGYCKENCKWSTRSEQARNRSTSYRWFVHGVEYATVALVAEKFGVAPPVAARWFSGYISRGKKYPPKDGYIKEIRYK